QMKPNCLILSIFLAGPALGAAPVENHSIVADHGSRDIRESWQVAADARIDVSNVRGTLTISAWEKAEAEMSGTLGGDSRLEISGDAQHLVLHVDGAHDGLFGRSGPDHDSDLIVHVPKGASLDVAVVSADAAVSGVAGKRLQVDGVSGKLTLSSAAPEIDVN